MQCKIFSARNLEKLEQSVNDWLKVNPVTPESMHMQFSTVIQEDDVTFALIYTLVLFYVPMIPLWKE